MLRNSYPYTTSLTFSSLPTTHCTSPLMNSSPHRTDFRTNPLSSPKPLSPERNSVPFLDWSSRFPLLVYVHFVLPLVLQSTGLHFISCMNSSLDSIAVPHPLHSTGSLLHFPFPHHMIVYLFSLGKDMGMGMGWYQPTHEPMNPYP